MTGKEGQFNGPTVRLSLILSKVTTTLLQKT